MRRDKAIDIEFLEEIRKEIINHHKNDANNVKSNKW